MEMDMQEPGEVCRSLADSRIPAASKLGVIGVAGMNANRIIITVRNCAGAVSMHHPSAPLYL